MDAISRFNANIDTISDLEVGVSIFSQELLGLDSALNSLSRSQGNLAILDLRQVWHNHGCVKSDTNDAIIRHTSDLGLGRWVRDFVFFICPTKLGCVVLFDVISGGRKLTSHFISRNVINCCITKVIYSALVRVDHLFLLRVFYDLNNRILPVLHDDQSHVVLCKRFGIVRICEGQFDIEDGLGLLISDTCRHTQCLSLFVKRDEALGVVQVDSHDRFISFPI